MKDIYMELYEKFSKLQWLLQRHHLQNHAEHGPFADPTRGQGRVLAILKMQPEISTKDMAYLLGIRQQSLNELLNKLERSGYVTRTQSETDKRVMIIRLTEKGKNEQYADTDFGDIFNCLNEDEQKLFNEYLDRVIVALEGQVGSKSDDDVFDWMRSVRSRMGEEQFEHLMSLRRWFGDMLGDKMRGGHFGHGFHGFGHHRHGHRKEGHMSGDNSFDPEYKGPAPGEGKVFFK